MVADELRAIHAKRLWLDATSIVGLVMAVVTMTWLVSAERNEINASLAELRLEILAVVAKQTELAERVNDRWTPRDMDTFKDVWCSKAEQLNKGWACPEIEIKGIKSGGD
jgi:hypothetical protein